MTNEQINVINNIVTWCNAVGCKSSFSESQKELRFVDIGTFTICKEDGDYMEICYKGIPPVFSEKWSVTFNKTDDGKYFFNGSLINRDGILLEKTEINNLIAIFKKAKENNINKVSNCAKNNP